MIVETFDKDAMSLKIVLPLPYNKKLWKELDFILDSVSRLEQQYLVKHNEDTN